MISQNRINNKSTESKSRHQKSLIYPICTIISVISVIAIIIIVAISLNKNPISDDYFISDDTKSVITLESEESQGSDNTKKTRVVYTYEDDQVTSLKTYFEYPDTESARTAFDSLKNEPEFTGAELNDKYIIVTTDPSQYQGLTASDVKQQTEAIQQLQNANKPPESQSEEQATEPSDESTEE